MFSITNLSIIEFAGHDARQFLHNQLSADVLGIADQESGFACCCNPAGRVIGLLLLCRQGDNMLAICSASLAEELEGWLKRFVFRDKVTIRLRDDLCVAGGKGDMPHSVEWETCVGIAYPVLAADPAIAAASDKQLARLKSAELTRGICWLAPQTSAQFLPQMLAFEKIGALSFSKGCYPGQEVIARTRYLGKLKRRAVLLRADATVEPPLMGKLNLAAGDEQWSAVIVDFAALEDDSTMVLAVARKGDDTEPRWLELEGSRIPLLAD
ncbi:MAG: hypothetical protein KJO85_04615 [Gammaproteobacteria bacterium]|nr:hypothetical protein [Gammaproteobacteria bacterium]